MSLKGCLVVLILCSVVTLATKPQRLPVGRTFPCIFLKDTLDDQVQSFLEFRIDLGSG